MNFFRKPTIIFARFSIFSYLLCGFNAYAQNQAVSGDLDVTGTIKAGSTSTYGGTEFLPSGIIVSRGGPFSSSPANLLGAYTTSGPRMLWYPQRAVFRANREGTGLPNNPGASGWDESKIGTGSAAFGDRTQALGNYSFSAGFFSKATGHFSTSFGTSSLASGYSSFAANGTATGEYSVALSSGVALGARSLAIGTLATATGYNSTSVGENNAASGNYATALGFGTRAKAFGSLVVGTYNSSSGSESYWSLSDPIFQVGNGIPPYVDLDTGEVYEPETRSNALTVFKNGNVEVQGVITCAPGGDIPMYTGE